MSVHHIWASVVTALGVVAALVVLSVNHVDADGLLTVCAVVVSPVISALVVLVMRSEINKVSTQVAAATTKIEEVDSKVNGHLTALTAKIPDAKTEE